MDGRAIATMVGSDLRQRLRDRSVLVFGLAVPFALIVVFNFLFADVGGTDQLEPTTVALAGAATPTGERVDAALSGVDVLDVTVTALSAPDARQAVADGDADLAVLVPPSTGGSDAAATGPVVDADAADVEVVNRGDGSIEAAIVTSVVDDVVARVATGTRVMAAGTAAGLEPAVLGPLVADVVADDLVTTSAGPVADEQLSLQGSLVAGQTALFMFFTVGYGVISWLTERDQGTLPRLQTMPMRPRSVIVAKTIVSFVLGVVATAVLLGAGGLLFDISFGAVVPVAVLVVATVAAATSLVLVVTKVARTSEQANTANTILSLAIGVLGGAFFPIGDGGLVSRLSDLTPPAAFIRGLGITHAGGGVVDLAEPLATVAGFLVVAVVLATVLPGREVEA